MTKTIPAAGPSGPDLMLLETRIRSALYEHSIKLDLDSAAALLSIAIDHFAAHPPPLFMKMVADLPRAANHAWSIGALCPTCRAELGRDKRTGALACEWCKS